VLRQLQARQLDVDVVITDIVMPDPDGLTVIERLRAERPEIPIIAASGLADERTDKALEAGAEEFLSKPFTAEKLQSALQRVLHLNEEPAAPSR
jgi:CheY-like chemotaxis protein